VLDNNENEDTVHVLPVIQTLLASVVINVLSKLGYLWDPDVLHVYIGISFKYWPFCITVIDVSIVNKKLSCCYDSQLYYVDVHCTLELQTIVWKSHG